MVCATCSKLPQDKVINTMSKLYENNYTRWVKNGCSQSYSNADTSKNSTATPKTSDDLQKDVRFDAFHTLTRKYNAKNYVKNEHTNTNDQSIQEIKKRYTMKEHTTKSADADEPGKWKRVTDKNSLEHFDNTYPYSLKGFNNNKYINSLTTNLNSVEDVPKRFNRNLQTMNEPLGTVSNYKRVDVKKDTSIDDSWKENNYIDKMRLAWLSHNSLAYNHLIPFINLRTMANPFMPVPIEVSRLANNMDLNMAEILCRKRTETGMIYWMLYKLNQLNAPK